MLYAADFAYSLVVEFYHKAGEGELPGVLLEILDGPAP